LPASDASVDALVNQLSDQLGTVNSRGNCAMCNKPIIGDCMEAMGKKFHVDHFVCQSCQTPLGGGVQFFEANGKPNCVDCHKALIAPKCGSCNEAILDRCVTALGKKWHVHHFVCAACQQPFTSQFFQRDGMPYCTSLSCLAAALLSHQVPGELHAR
jgi:paxillin